MFLFIPYRAKNPPVVFPWATVALIVVNVLVYALTTEKFLVITRSALEDFAISHAQFTPLRLFTHMFFHANLSHLFGNMLFLWVFGGSVEGRLRWYFYLPFYIGAGMVAGIAHDAVNGALNPTLPCVGASGAIMSLLGAYLWLSPHSRVLVAYVIGAWTFRVGVTNWEARWLILTFPAVDIVQGFFFRNTGTGGVANFAHLGGMLAGYLLVRFSKMAQESTEFSRAQAMRSDFGGNYDIMDIWDLEAIVNGPQPTAGAVLAYCRRALDLPEGDQKAADVVGRHALVLLEQGDIIKFAELALDFPPTGRQLPGAFLLALGERLEEKSWFDLALKVYRRVSLGNETTPESEAALLHVAHLTEVFKKDKKAAAAVYREQVRLFPEGPRASVSLEALARLPEPVQVYSARKGEFGTGDEDVHGTRVDETTLARARYLATPETPEGFAPPAAVIPTRAKPTDDLMPLPTDDRPPTVARRQGPIL